MTVRKVYARRERPLWVVDPEAVAYAMRKAGVPTVRELAEGCRLGKSAVYEAVSGARVRPTAATMCEIASALGVDVLDLMTDGDELDG